MRLSDLNGFYEVAYFYDVQSGYERPSGFQPPKIIAFGVLWNGVWTGTDCAKCIATGVASICPEPDADIVLNLTIDPQFSDPNYLLPTPEGEFKHVSITFSHPMQVTKLRDRVVMDGVLKYGRFEMRATCSRLYPLPLSAERKGE
jgi:hypothetical protein